RDSILNGWRPRLTRNRRSGEMAGRELSRLVLDQRRDLILEDGELRDRTSRMKNAAAGRIERRRDVAFQQDSTLVNGRVRNRDCRQKSLCIWMQRIGVESTTVGKLHDFAEIHDSDAGGDVLDHR